MGCIYKAENCVNHKVYIGKTTKVMENRRKDHLYKSSRGSNTYFHKAITKYGKENFVWSVLEESSDETVLFEKEKEYISKFRSNDPEYGYNLTVGGEGVSGRVIPAEENERRSKAVSAYLKGKPKSEETKEKIRKTLAGRPRKLTEDQRKELSERMSGEGNPMYGKATRGFEGKSHSEDSKKKISVNNGRHNLGKKLSDETRKRMSQSSMGKPGTMTGRHHSEETRAKMSMARRLRDVTKNTEPSKGDK